MANENNNSFNFEIPTALIVIAWIGAWPIGLVLTILRVLSDEYKKNNRANAAKTAAVNRPGSTSQQSAFARPAVSPSAARKKKAAFGKKNVPALLLKIFGYIFLAAAAVISLNTLISLFSAASIPVLLAESVPPLALMAGSGLGMLIGSSSLRKRDVRLARIRALIGNHESFNLSKLAAASDSSIRQVRRDVQRLIDADEFGSKAYIDLGTNNFMRTPEAEPDDPLKFDYKDVYGNLFKGKKKGENVQLNPDDIIDIASDNDDFKSIIREIRRLNAEIKDTEVSDRIYKIENHTKNIFEYVSAHPESMTQIRTFLNYYLPTTLKLLESYSRIEKVGVAGENMQKSKENIESTLDMLEKAFKHQIDDLFRNESLDISSDISVLETMIDKDGLNGKDDFDLSSYTDDISDEIGGSGAAGAEYPKK